MANKAVRYKFIKEYIEANHATSVVDQLFHDMYNEEFPEYKRKLNMWGACSVAQAMKDLSLLYNDGTLIRNSVSLGANWQPGFPKWVYSYRLI